MDTEEDLKAFYMTPTETSILCIDIVDACNLHCASCVRGNRYIKNSHRVMPYELFTKIIDKAARLGISSIELFNWTEPFLCKELPKYAAYVQKKGLICHISSNLSLPNIPHLIPTLKHCEFLVISVSGFTQDVYKINHRGGNINFVKRNMERIGDALRRGELALDVYIHYLIFEHSQEEFPLFKEFAEQQGMKAVPWRGLGFSEAHASCSHNNEHVWSQKHLDFNRMAYPLSDGGCTARQCLGSITPVPLDCEGNVFLCVFKPSIEKLRVGNFLDDDFDILQYRRFAHPVCAVCENWYRNRLVAPRPYHKMSLLRGMMKSLDISAAQGAEAAEEMAAAARLAGQKVYFWGCGEMFRRKRHVFSNCRPVCLLADTPSRPDSVEGLAVRHPDEVVPSGETLPVVIFAGKTACETILRTIRQNYPKLTDIYCCTSS